MLLLGTIKEAVDSGDAVECSAFILRVFQLNPGDNIQQIRESVVVATWQIVKKTARGFILKDPAGAMKAESFQFGDEIHVEEPAIEEKEMEHPKEAVKVFVFSGKNWKLASPKKWVPMSMDLNGHTPVGEINLSGKLHTVYKLPDCFAAQEKTE